MLEKLLEEFQKNYPEFEIKQKDNEGKWFDLRITMREHVQVKKLDDLIFFSSLIATVPEKKREDLFSLLMKANFLGQGTGGCIIGLDANEKFLTLALTMPYETDYGHFVEYLESFVNYLSYWHKAVEDYKKRESII